MRRPVLSPGRQGANWLAQAGLDGCRPIASAGNVLPVDDPRPAVGRTSRILPAGSPVLLGLKRARFQAADAQADQSEATNGGIKQMDNPVRCRPTPVKLPSKTLKGLDRLKRVTEKRIAKYRAGLRYFPLKTPLAGELMHADEASDRLSKKGPPRPLLSNGLYLPAVCLSGELQPAHSG